MAVQQATRTIPIVMVLVIDPVGIGLVPSLARPGGNVTGTSFMAPDLPVGRARSTLVAVQPPVRGGLHQPLRARGVFRHRDATPYARCELSLRLVPEAGGRAPRVSRADRQGKSVLAGDAVARMKRMKTAKAIGLTFPTKYLTLPSTGYN